MREDPGFADGRGKPRDQVKPTASSRVWIFTINILPGRLKQMGVRVERGIKQTIALFFGPADEGSEQGDPIRQPTAPARDDN